MLEQKEEREIQNNIQLNLPFKDDIIS